MLELEVSDLQWIDGPDDNPADQCAHGRVAISLDGAQLASVTEGLWTVSATALFLLRSLEHDHDKTTSITDGNRLLPCCGFCAWPHDGRFPVIITGCPLGIDLWIRHENGQVLLKRDKTSVTISAADWKKAVLNFVDVVENFYEQASPKDTPDDSLDQVGWKAFWKEWEERKAVAMEPT